LPDRIPEDLPDRMSDRMSEDVPEDMPGRIIINMLSLTTTTIRNLDGY
jgi:hypothetical protein